MSMDLPDPSHTQYSLTLWEKDNQGFVNLDLISVRFSLVATPWTAACQASLSLTNSRSLLKLMSTDSVMPSTISSSVVPFSFHLQSFPVSGSFQMSQLFASGGQSIHNEMAAAKTRTSWDHMGLLLKTVPMDLKQLHVSRKKAFDEAPEIQALFVMQPNLSYPYRQRTPSLKQSVSYLLKKLS